MKRGLMIILPFAILLGAILLVGVMIKSRKPVKPQPVVVLPPLVRVQPVKQGTYGFHVYAQGSVSPRTDITVASEVSGRIVSVAPSFAEGGFFEKGELLVAIDARDYELALTQAKARLEEAEVKLTKERAEAEVARKEWIALGKQASEANPLVLRKPQIAEAEAGIASAKAAVEQAKRDLERCQIKAPFAGRVWEKKADVGQYVTKNAVVARIYAVDYAEVRLPLPTDELAYVDLPFEYRGDQSQGPQPKVKLTANFAGQPHTWEGRVVRTEGQIDNRTRMMNAVVRVDDPYAHGADGQRPPLSIGLFVSADIQGKTVKDVYVVPRAAYRGNNELMVVDKENKLRFRKVDVLRLEMTNVVLRSGIEAGDRACISPLDAPVDGMDVRLGDEQKAVASEAKGSL